MNGNQILEETRQVSDFNRVAIRGNACSAQLFITQGERESLTIEAPQEYIHRLRSDVEDGKLTIRLQGSWFQELEDALSTCMNRPIIRYYLEVRELSIIEVQCAYSVSSKSIETPHLHVILNGTGDFNLGQLSAETLEVHHSGTGIVRISGHVMEQTVALNGVGSYRAAGLESQHARVQINGTGFVRIRVSQTLDATLRGAGVLEYSGCPAVNQRITGPGQLVHFAESRVETP